ncbi:Spliceosome-associated protein [Vigna angularis]|uniref:Spliceosome-associated protein n=1 Tax=Phaseolus angularis TaxID=3914 RepID=A0A8T0JQQ3_PHAAN|nr:Spliceosome-associated protein [Vigna angularis]
MFFFLLQTEYGDIFKSGFLFVALEFGNHALYQFKSIGDEDDVEASCATLMETEEGFPPVFFQPRRLENLVRIDQVESLMPIMDMKVSNLFEEETPQIFTLCGRGPRSSFRILRTGLAVSEMIVSKLPGIPSVVWTVKKNVIDEFDAYVVVSQTQLLCFLIISETVEEVTGSGFLDTTPSLDVSLIRDDSLMQVHPNGIWHIMENGHINEWRTPGKRTISKVGSNRLQVVIAVSGGEVIYFEVDVTGQLMEVEKHEISGDVACTKRS